MTAAAITKLSRRTFGLFREVYAIRCRDCRWRTEVRELSTAVALCRNHTCSEADHAA